MKIYGNEKITDAFKRGELTVAVYGLGKMGLPLAAIFASKGAKVIGADVNEEVVMKINQGINHVKGEPGLDELVEENVKRGRLKATTDLVKAAKDSDVMIILVPAFLDENNESDLGIVKSVSEDIAKGIEKGDFVIVETTVPPGTTDRVVRQILEKSGLNAGEDFGMAHCPERTSSGRAIEDILGAYPKVVGGIDKKSTDTAEAIYRIINEKGVIPVTSSTEAEMVKIAEGLYRDVNIALANELALISERCGADVFEVIKTANTQPFCNLHRPGAGVGGHCIPVYPWFVMNEETRLIRTAREVNDSMPGHVVDKVSKTLNDHGENIKDSNVLVAGLVYRPGVKETYHTPAREVIKKLRKLGANVYGYDPVFTENEMKSVLNVESPNGNKIDCTVFIHDEKYNLDVDAERAVTLENLFNNGNNGR
jgi:nucleotide sugar dehydrogenase